MFLEMLQIFSDTSHAAKPKGLILAYKYFIPYLCDNIPQKLKTTR